MKLKKEDVYNRKKESAVASMKYRGEIIKEIEHNNEEILVVLDQCNDKIDILFYEFVVYNEIIARINLKREKDKLVIIELESKYERCGHGTLLIKQVIEQAKKRGIAYITGGLSEEDDVEYNINFYKKRGFEVYENADKRGFVATISMKL